MSYEPEKRTPHGHWPAIRMPSQCFIGSQIRLRYDFQLHSQLNLNIYLDDSHDSVHLLLSQLPPAPQHSSTNSIATERQKRLRLLTCKNDSKLHLYLCGPHIRTAALLIKHSLKWRLAVLISEHCSAMLMVTLLFSFPFHWVTMQYSFGQQGNSETASGRQVLVRLIFHDKTLLRLANTATPPEQQQQKQQLYVRCIAMRFYVLI